jgi:hypothetical protein
VTESEFTPEKLIMEANIREFAYKISMICALEVGGKITPEEAYHRIRENWRELKASRQNLLSPDEPPPAQP